MRAARRLCFAALSLLVTPGVVSAAELRVGSGEAFATIGAALASARDGDVVLVTAGTYSESLTTQGPGVTVRAAAAAQVIVTSSGRVFRIDHPRTTVEGIVLDGQYGARDAVTISTAADDVVLRRVEVRRSGRDCIDIQGPKNLLIDESSIHHCLNSTSPACSSGACRVDAHGVVAGPIQGLTIRNTEIHTISGDAVQLDPGRSTPIWTDVLIEGCRLWSGPLSVAEGGYAAGINPAENAVDTKTPNDQSAPARLTIRDTVAWGFRNGLISNMAAFNLKENVRADLDRVTVFDSEIAFRLRGATGSRPDGVEARIYNTIIYDCDKAVRYEDDIVPVELWQVTLGASLGVYFQRAGAPTDTIRGRNVLAIATGLPSELVGGSNLAAGDGAVVDAAGHDYRLVAGSMAIDRGEPIANVPVDRDGVSRPQGAGWDVGAYEYCTGVCPSNDADAGAGPVADGGSGGGADAAAGATGTTAGGCGCGSSSTPALGNMLLMALCLLVGRRGRRAPTISAAQIRGRTSSTLRVCRVAAAVAILSAWGCGGGDDTGSARDGAVSIDGGVGGDAATTDAGPPWDAAPRPDAGPPLDLPLILNHSGASTARVQQLAREAIAGLGFGTSAQGPNPDDRLFVGRHYMAWIDETGFYGKMNGLWRLDGAAADALDFVVRDTTGRPVNFFVVGENGDGAWPPGYPGAEHIEFPNRVPEPNDNASCASGDWCNQYALNEATQITDPDIPWWSACNGGAPAWTEHFTPIAVESITGGIRLVYEGPLVKEADGDGNPDGDACHQNYLFDDGVRRLVYLRVGYELLGDQLYFDRTMQLRNPAGNPDFDGPMSLIGGFVVTQWPNPHPLKKIDRFLRPETRNVTDTRHSVTLVGGQWNDHGYAATSSDEVFAWLDQPISLSVSDQAVAGRSVTLNHVGPSDNADIGICFCSVHGGLELGGGLIHGGTSLPIAGGAMTPEARRRLTLTGTPQRAVHVYEAEADLSHAVGQAETDGWSASTAADSAEHMAFGPYATNWGGVSAAAAFHLQVDNNVGSAVVVTVDLYDATSDQILASRALRRNEFADVGVYTTFVLTSDLIGRTGHTMETRVYWHDVSYVRLDKVVVTTD